MIWNDLHTIGPANKRVPPGIFQPLWQNFKGVFAPYTFWHSLKICIGFNWLRKPWKIMLHWWQDFLVSEFTEDNLWNCPNEKWKCPIPELLLVPYVRKLALNPGKCQTIVFKGKMNDIKNVFWYTKVVFKNAYVSHPNSKLSYFLLRNYPTSLTLMTLNRTNSVFKSLHVILSFCKPTSPKAKFFLCKQLNRPPITRLNQHLSLSDEEDAASRQGRSSTAVPWYSKMTMV